MVVNLDNGMLGCRENKFTITIGNMNKSYKHNSVFFFKKSKSQDYFSISFS